MRVPICAEEAEYEAQSRAFLRSTFVTLALTGTYDHSIGNCNITPFMC